ncbi:DNA polymerase III subunit alpha [Euzebya tangerina]|uniref:DNA polymerase III subunit alpha n=1 Tax=Euzebya tangerina TaxID=591198 RepID=UPI000E31FCC3|nr:DNA polymerase III subunit alpha [Euzebya tangerina]
MGDFAHLHVHTEYSMLDGASRVGQLMDAVERLEMPAVAMTDHGVMFGAIDFHRQAVKRGINPIIGCELYLAPHGRRNTTELTVEGKRYYHLTALASNQVGYRNLMKLTSRAYAEGYWYKPRVDREMLEEHSEGLIILSGCLGAELNQKLLVGNVDDARETAGWYREVFGDRYYIELQDHGIPEQHATNGQLIQIAKAMDVGLVVTNDSHYTEQTHFDAHDALLCVQTGALKSETDRFKFHNDQFFVKPAEQMQALFPDHPETWKNTLEIAERCHVEFDFDSMHLPKFDCPADHDEASYLREKVKIGAVRRYGAEDGATTYEGLRDEVKQRIEYEVGVIEDMGFSAYFLIVADLIDHARDVGIRVGPGRGSAAGCAVSYCTGITDLDPIHHGLLFERFLNPERISMPDIDMDFDERRRGEMIRYTAQKYGQDHVAQIVTFQTIKAKQAIKDATRVLGLPYAFGDRLCKMFPPAVQGKEAPLADALQQSGELAEAKTTNPDAAKVLDLAAGLEGLRRQHSIHAAGVVIADEPITDIVPTLQVDGEAEVVTQYDGRQVEDLGLLKMDFLGLRNLTIISDALEHIEMTTGEKIDVDHLPLDDAETYALIGRGETDGVFQLESAGYKALCKLMQPDRFEDITALGALYRPGPMSANLHVEYANRKNGLSPVTYIHEDVTEILQESYGLLIYQEQVQKIAQKIAGFSLGQADGIRKAIGKKLKDKMAAIKNDFIEGTVASGYPKKLGTDLWSEIEGFASYAFNKSHSAAYGLVTYQTAWLKTHYPVEYMAALLTSVKNNKDKLPAALHSCRTMGIEVLVPDINDSLINFAPVVTPSRNGGQAAGDTDGPAEIPPRQIRFGMSAVRNVGEGVVDEIIQARRSRGAFTDFHDFVDKVPISTLNKRTIESLVKAGGFESLGHPRKGLQLVVDPIIENALAIKRREEEGQYDLFGGLGGAGEDETELDAVEIPDFEFDRKEKLQAEREMLGLYVSDHPLHGLERALEEISSAPIPAIHEAKGGADVTIAGLLTAVTKKFTKKGESYVVGTIEDLQGGIEVMFFPSCYTRYADLLVEDEVLVVQGRVDDGRDTTQLIADRVSRPDLSEATGAPLNLSLHPRQCAPEMVTRLRAVLAEHAGPVDVRLTVAGLGGRSTELAVPESLGVRRSQGLFAELKSLLGAQCL